MYCKKCGRQIHDNERFCSNCGAVTNYGVRAGTLPAGNSAANIRICPSCGRENKAGRFCSFCGASLLAAADAPNRAAAQQAARPQTAQQPRSQVSQPAAPNRAAAQQATRQQAAQPQSAQQAVSPPTADSQNRPIQAKAPKQAKQQKQPKPQRQSKQSKPPKPQKQPKQSKPPKVKKHKLVPLKVMLIIICVILIALGIFLIPPNIRAARKGSKPIIPFISSESSGTDMISGKNKNSGKKTYSETDRIVIKEVNEDAPIPEIPEVEGPDPDEVFDTADDIDFSTVVGKEGK